MAKQQFYIPLCVDNLAQYFAFGFITSASNFPFNHYLPDEFLLHPQRIPLHKKPNSKLKIPSEGLRQSRSLDENLKSAVVVVSMEESQLEKPENTQWLYLNDILPIYLIDEIIFEDEDAFEHFDYLTRKTGRVSEARLNLIKYNKTGIEKLFKEPGTDDLLIDSKPLESQGDGNDSKTNITSLHKMSAYGAALALSYVMAKNGQVASDAFKALANFSINESQIATSLVMTYLLRDLEEEQSKHKIQNEFFDALIQCNNKEKVFNTLLTFFNMDFSDEKISTFLETLKYKSSEILKGKIKETKSEQMEKFDKVTRVGQFIEQVVTMFSNFQETEKLFTQPISTMNDEGYFNLAIAYGFRDKFYELPKSVRQINELESFIIESMYRYYQRITAHKLITKVNFKQLPTLIDIINDPETPELRDSLSKKFGLISKNMQQSVVVSGHHYVPKNPTEMVEIWPSTSKEFIEKMIMNKAFDDVNFNLILELHQQEKKLSKDRKKLEKNLNSL